MTEKTTSTFTIHHDRCDPSKWTVREWSLLAEFVKTGSLQAAAGLSRLGMQLALDGRHASVGGTVEHIGWMRGKGGDFESDAPADSIGELEINDLEVTEVVPIYRGPTRYAVGYGIGDDEGHYDGQEIEVCDTFDAAEKFAKSIRGLGAGR